MSAATTDAATVKIRQYRNGRAKIRELDHVVNVDHVQPRDDPTETALRVEYAGGVSADIPGAELLDGGDDDV